MKPDGWGGSNRPGARGQRPALTLERGASLPQLRCMQEVPAWGLLPRPTDRRGLGMIASHERALEFIEAAQRYDRPEPLFADFQRLLSEYGFQHFVLTGLPPVGENFDGLMICNRWPEEWSQTYRDRRYFRDDPVSRWSLSKRRPFRWSSARRGSEKTPRSREIDGAAAEFGLRDGIAFPLASDGWQSVISLASDRQLDLGQKDEGLLYLASTYLKMAATDMLVEARPDAPQLSQREAEILSWIAAGKTAWEVSMILGLSHNTVEVHVRNIRQKFDSPNVTHAVVRAIATRQLRL